MSLRSILASGVKITNNVTKSVQTTVTLRRRTASPGDGGVSTETATTILVALDSRQTQVRTPAGVLMTSSAHIIFIDAAALAAATAGHGVSVHDRVTLPDGVTYQILTVSGFIDPDTEIPFATEAFLG